MKETDKSSSKTITDYQNEENNKLSRTSTTTGPFTVSTISGRTSDVPVIFGKEKIKLVLIGILLKMDQSMMTIINNCPGGKNYSGRSNLLKGWIWRYLVVNVY